MRLAKNIFIFSALICLTVLVSCKKDKGKLPTTEIPLVNITPEPPFICEDTAFDWTPFPPEPDFGWQFHSAIGSKSPWRVLYDLKDKNVIYFSTYESNGSTHKLWKYNRKTNTKILLDEQVLIDIDISSTGWLVYEKFDKNIYKIKTNGDSLTKLTTKGTYLFPSWSEDGRFIFYFDDYYGKPGKSIIQANSNGTIVDTLENVGAAATVHSRKNYFYFADFDGKEFNIVQLELNSQKRRTVVSRANNFGEDMGYCFTNPENTVLYWSNYKGLYKTDIRTLKTTKIINGGYGSRNNFLHYRQSPLTKRFVAIQFIREVISPYALMSSAKIVEFTEDGACKQTITIPD